MAGLGVAEKKQREKKRELSQAETILNTYSSCLCWGISGSQWYLKHYIGTLNLYNPRYLASIHLESISRFHISMPAASDKHDAPLAKRQKRTSQLAKGQARGSKIFAPFRVC